ncbi:MAG TPA: dihydrofolate reductase, partial [Anaerolineae bacterium]
MSNRDGRHISFVVAMDRNRVIGVGGRLPWRLPDDMKWFKEVTMGKPVIMGRKTYDSIPNRFKPLAGRHNIVLTRNRDYRAEGATVVHSVEEALAATGDADEIMIGGGAQLYEALLPQADRLYLTLVDGTFEGDTYFPELDMREWRERYRQDHDPDERHLYRFTWLILEREV